MKTWDVVLTASAETDLDEIYSYIAETLLAPVTAWRQTARILKAIFKLDEMPERCPLLANEPWHSRGLRRLTIDNYSAIYEIDASVNRVSVVAIVYSKRNIDNVLRQEDW